MAMIASTPFAREAGRLKWIPAGVGATLGLSDVRGVRIPGSRHRQTPAARISGPRWLGLYAFWRASGQVPDLIPGFHYPYSSLQFNLISSAIAT